MVEQGTHRHLLETGGYYASLAAKQTLPQEDLEQDTSGGTARIEPAPSSCKDNVRVLRDSILRRGSVRLSVIPQARNSMWAVEFLVFSF